MRENGTFIIGSCAEEKFTLSVNPSFSFLLKTAWEGEIGAEGGGIVGGKGVEEGGGGREERGRNEGEREKGNEDSGMEEVEERISEGGKGRK